MEEESDGEETNNDLDVFEYKDADGSGVDVVDVVAYVQAEVFDDGECGCFACLSAFMVVSISFLIVYMFK